MNKMMAKYNARVDATGSLICVGLDSDFEELPEMFRGASSPQFEFNRWVIEQTAKFASSYKLNSAFYEARGAAGMDEMRKTAEFLRERYPEIVTICDAKRADIGNTNRGYVTSIFDEMGFDAVTLHPYLGREALAPFLEREDKLCIVLCRTSNTGAGEMQDLLLEGRPLWQHVAEKVSHDWNGLGNCLLVVGATYPDEMRVVREIAPEVTFLVPGVGAQGGSATAAVQAGLDARGRGLMISSSRGIIFDRNPADAARKLYEEIQAAREVVHAAH